MGQFEVRVSPIADRVRRGTGVAMLSIHVQIHVIPGHWQQTGLIWCAVRVLVPVVVLWCLAGMQDTTRRAVPTYLVLGRGEVGGTASRSQSRRRRCRRRRRRAGRRATQRVMSCEGHSQTAAAHSLPLP
jgi:hypothetical protein